ncbi:hypothetical protein QAD02_023685 [Eretmocerus hayati]|uniref:Uncharacterized protein n=1 Tax=Eretmocerus hayati TaxID=131215 RepID=A0ACC2PWV8_9HYME|nr:hypothetical protein QAD02_023685 [Eretmocerus hayati]
MVSTKSHRGVVLVSFILALLCGSLICISLVSNHWVESKPWRKSDPQTSSGRVYFGLLYGKKELNVAFGVRLHDIVVSDMIHREPELMSWSLWCTTLVSTVLALLLAGLTAFLSVINSVITPNHVIFSITGIYLTNIISFLMCAASTATWLIQFQTKLNENLLLVEDLENSWTSRGASKIGFSFWLVFAAGIIHVVSVILIKWSTIKRRQKSRKPLTDLEEKSTGVIMLY